MAALADAGRRLPGPTTTAGAAWSPGSPVPPGGPAAGTTPSKPGLVLRDGEVTLVADAPIDHRHRRWPCGPRPRRPSSTSPWPDPRWTAWPPRPRPGGVWPPETLRALLRLLGAGRPAVAAIESLDQLGHLGAVPARSGQPIRNRPQRNAYHRFTVDRHLLETAAGAAALTLTWPDRTCCCSARSSTTSARAAAATTPTIGIEIVGELAPRLGLPAGDAATLQTLVRYHLLLPEAATRRDLDDPATAAGGGRRRRRPGDPAPAGRPDRGRQPGDRPGGVGPVEGRAGGPAGRGDRGRPRGPAASRRAGPPLGPEQRALLGAGQLQLLADGGRVTVVAPDRPGLLATVAGVLTLCGRDGPVGHHHVRCRHRHGAAALRGGARLRRAARTGTGCGRTSAPPSTVGWPWPPCSRSESGSTPGTGGPRLPPLPEVRVTIDNAASAASTVVEVRAPTGARSSTR